MSDFLFYANWLYLLSSKRFIRYILSDEKEDTYDDYIFVKLLPKDIVEKSIETVKILDMKISNNGSKMDRILQQYLPYKEKEIKSIKYDIINAALGLTELYIVFVSSYDSEFTGSFYEIDKTCFVIIVKYVEDNIYEIIRYVYVKPEYKDMYDIKTIGITCYGDISIEKWGMGCQQFFIHKYDYIDLFKQKDNVIKNIVELMNKEKNDTLVNHSDVNDILLEKVLDGDY